MNVSDPTGCDVLVIEKADLIGGTTALSEGMIWIPRWRILAVNADSPFHGVHALLDLLCATKGAVVPIDGGFLAT